jgi:GAF domain-containing protein
MTAREGQPDPDARREAALGILRLVAREADTARRLQGDVETPLLQSVVDAAAALFDAEAASIALYDAQVDRLVYRVASGRQGASIIGISVTPTSGIAGHVFSTGDAAAVADVAADPRSDTETARRSGYLPRNLAAVPLSVGDARSGVLQVLDKRADDGFSPRDMELLAAFARQAGAAIEAARTSLDMGSVLRDVIATAAGGSLGDEALRALTSAATAELGLGSEGSSWSEIVHVASGWQGRSEADVRLLTEIVEAFAHHR